MPQNQFEDSILKAIGDDPNGCTTEKICRLLRNTPQDLGSAFELLKSEGKILGFAGAWFSITGYDLASARFLAALNRIHAANPMLQSILPEQAVKEAELSWSGKPLDRILSRLVMDGTIEFAPPGIRSLSVPLQLTARQTAFLERVVVVLETEPVNTPSPQNIAQQLGLPRQAVEEVLKLGVHSGVVLRLDEGVFYTPRQIESLKELIREVTESKPFSMTDLRDKLQTTRKYVVPLLDYLDSVGFTVGNQSERVVVRLDT